MTSRNNLSSRTSSSKLRRKMILPGWVIAIVVLTIVGTGIYFVYNSFASSTSDTRIGDNNGTVTLYCRRDRSKCYFQKPQPPNTIALQGYIYANSSCRYGLEYRLLGTLKGTRNCLSVYVYP